MLQNTLKAALTERLWSQSLDRETRYVAAQDAARLLSEQAAEVAAAYASARDDDNCRFTPGGVPVQMAMRLTEKATGRAVSVVCKADGAGAKLWFILDMSAAPYEAAAYIRAVENRLAANKNEQNRRAN